REAGRWVPAYAGTTTKPRHQASRNWKYRRSGALEIDALGDREAVKVAAQAVEPQFDRAEAHPFAPAEDARAARLGGALSRDADADRPAEVDPVRAFI